MVKQNAEQDRYAQMIEKSYFFSTSSHDYNFDASFVSIKHFCDCLLRRLDNFISMFAFLIPPFVFPSSSEYISLRPKLNHLKMCIKPVEIVSSARLFRLTFSD